MPRHAPRTAAFVAASAALLCAGGCYRHVVSAKGPGAQNYEIHDANIQRGESVWSDQPAQQRRKPMEMKSPGGDPPSPDGN